MIETWKVTCSPLSTRPGAAVASTLSLGSCTIVLALDPVLTDTVAACSHDFVEVATTLSTTVHSEPAASIGLGQTWSGEFGTTSGAGVLETSLRLSGSS